MKSQLLFVMGRETIGYQIVSLPIFIYIIQIFE